MNSKDLVESYPGVTARKLDYWANCGIFGDDARYVGSGRRRDYDQTACEIARVLGAFSESSPGPLMNRLPLYRTIAQHMLQGEVRFTVELAPGFTLLVDTKVDQ